MIYFDHHATMPVSQTHMRRVMDLLCACDGNPSSTHHYGRRARKALEDARCEVAQLMGCSRHHIFFVSGATEGNHSVVHSVCGPHHPHQYPTQLVIASGEHPCHIRACETMSLLVPMRLHMAPLGRDGRVDQEAFCEFVDPNTVYVGITHTHHQTGVIQDIVSLAQRVKSHAPNCHVHIDAAQSYGKQNLEFIATSCVDSLTASGHKIGALKGVGCVYVKDPEKYHPWLLGGGQERGKRAGTENLAGVLSMGIRASEIFFHQDWLDESRELYQILVAHLQKYPQVKIYGSSEHHSQLVICFSVAHRSAGELGMIWNQQGICMGQGSACSQSRLGASEVLMAMGYGEWEAKNAFRLSLGPQNTRQEVKRFCEIIDEILS